MKSTYRILFFTRKTRPNKDGLVTIAIRITIDGESIEFNPKLHVNPEIWNPIGRAEGKTKEAREINQALDNIRTDLKNHYDVLFEKYGYVTPEKLRNAYLGIDIQRNTLLSLFDVKVEQKKNLVGRTIRSTTLSKYLATKNRISDFIRYQYNKDD
ncbi:MAG: site-specific integrase, partial [Tannerellaceae bacterium]|nr:site-specific integrase [Tannerellaceae bacterium]